MKDGKQVVLKHVDAEAVEIATIDCQTMEREAIEIETPVGHIVVHASGTVYHVPHGQREGTLLLRGNEFQEDEMFKIENGRWFYYGLGADGTRWYDMGPADEEIPNSLGDMDGTTAQEAIEAHTLRVSDSGQPYIE
jgi:hypothetical protein